MSTREICRTWLDYELVSLAEAARMVGRTSCWTRRAIVTGDLEAVVLSTGGPEVVTVRSLDALVDRVERPEGVLEAFAAKLASGRRGVRALRLVVDNG
jgi:hypothetical protein